MQIKAIFIRMVLHLDTLWNKGLLQLDYKLEISMTG